MESEKSNRDKQIDALNEDISRQDEAIGKLGKEKKNLQDDLQERTEQLQASEDKCNSLNKAKKKLEDTLKDVSLTTYISLKRRSLLGKMPVISTSITKSGILQRSLLENLIPSSQ